MHLDPSAVGYYTGIGASEPTPCAIGRYGDSTRRTDDQCSGACAEGHYCAAGSITATPPSCTIDFYLEKNASSASGYQCVACDPELMDCSQPGTTLANMPIKAGGWRIGNGTATVYTCFNPDACVGAAGPAAAVGNTTGSVSRRRRLVTAPSPLELGTFGDSLCAPGHTGFLCGACVEGFYGYSDSKTCTACSGNMALSFVPLIILLLVALIALIVFWKGGDVTGGIDVENVMKGDGLQAALEEKMNEKMQEQADALADRVDETVQQVKASGGLKAKAVAIGAKVVTRAQKLGTKLKILLSLWQILQGLGPIFSIPFPPFYSSAVSSIGGLIQIELPALMPIDCIIPVYQSYYSKLVSTCIWPLIAYALLYVSSRCLRRRGKDGQADACIDFLFFIMFVVYPSISTKLLSMFYCVPFEDGTSWLRVDLSQQCAGEGAPLAQRSLVMIFTLIMLGLHTIGTPAVYCYLFFWKFSGALGALKSQELADAGVAQLQANSFIDDEHKESMGKALEPRAGRLDPNVVLPGYLKKLTGGYEYRTCEHRAGFRQHTQRRPLFQDGRRTLPCACALAPHSAETSHPSTRSSLASRRLVRALRGCQKGPPRRRPRHLPRAWWNCPALLGPSRLLCYLWSLHDGERA